MELNNLKLKDFLESNCEDGIAKYLCRICGQSNPTDLFFVFRNDVHCHQDIQCIIHAAPYILLIVVWRVQRLTIRLLFPDFNFDFMLITLFNKRRKNHITSSTNSSATSLYVVVPFSSTFLHTFIEKWRNPLPLRSAFLRRLIKLCTDWLRSQIKLKLKMRPFICWEAGKHFTYVSFLMLCELFKIFVLVLFDPDSFPICTMRAFWLWLPSFNAVYKMNSKIVEISKMQTRLLVRSCWSRFLPFAVMRLLYPFVLVLTMTVLMLMTYPLCAMMKKKFNKHIGKEAKSN